MSTTEIRSTQLTKLRDRHFWRWRNSRSKSSRPSGLAVLHDPGRDRAIVDLVAVHGFDGSFDTWTLGTRQKFAFGTSSTESWLTPDLLPGARILTFSYNTHVRHGHELTHRVLFGNSLRLVQNLSALREKTNSQNRPIIFVAHSIGGLIVKGALISCHDPANPGFSHIGESTFAVHFFGTPSSGRYPQSFSDALRNTFRIMFRPTRSHSKIPFSEVDAKWLEIKLQPFKPLLANIHLYTYYESEETDCIGQLVVQRQPSAKSLSSLDSQNSTRSTSSTGSNQTVLPNKDHANLMKFTRSNGEFKNFNKNLQDSLKRKSNRGAGSHEGSPVGSFISLEDSLRSASGGLHTLSNISKRKAGMINSPKLRTIFELHLSSLKRTTGFPIILLYGASSADLSTFAHSLASLVLTETPDVFMYRFNAETDATIIGGYLELARSLRTHYSHPEDDICGRAAGYLDRCIGIRNIDEMLKVDSIRNLEEIHIRSVIQAVHEWLLVPQNKDWLLIFENVADPHGIYEMLPLRVSGRIILTARDPEGIPVGKRVLVPMMTKIDDVSPALRPEELDDIWLDDGKRLARNILAVGSVLSEAPIHSALFDFDDKHFGGFTTRVLHSMERQGLLQSTRQVDETNRHAPHGVQFVIPQHVRSAGLERLERNKDVGNWVSVAAGLCIEFYRRAKETRNLLVIQACERITVPHARACYRWMKTGHRNDSGLLTVAILGDICLGQGALEEAEWFFQISLSHTVTLDRQADTVLLLSTILLRKGETKGCLERLQTLDFDKMIEDASLRFIAVKAQLTKAEALKIERRQDRGEGDIKKALDYMDDLESDLPRSECIFTFTRAHTARKLAENLLSQGKPEESQALYRRAFYEYGQLLGPHDPLTIETGEELTSTMHMCGQEDSALELLSRFQKDRTDSLGRKHPCAARTIARIGGMLDARGDREEAKKQYDDALGIMADTLGLHHPWVMWSKECMASGLSMRGKYKEAVEILDEVITAKISSPELYGKEDIALSEVKRSKAVELMYGRAFEEQLNKIVEELPVK